MKGPSETCEIAVIGAGVIGLAIAHRLASNGREVLVIDPAEPGSGASYGNAGTIADYAVQPVGTPDVLRNLPALLFNRDSPLAIRKAALVTLAPWLIRFLRQSLPGPARRNALALANLLADAAPRWDRLAADIGGAGLLQNRGCLYMFETVADRRATEADMAFRRDLGVQADLVSPDTLAALEPGLPPMPGGGVLFPGARFMTDPGRIVGMLAVAVERKGARFLRDAAIGLIRCPGHVRIMTKSGNSVNARTAIIAAGAHSRALAAMAGDRVPLDTERGYHLEFDGQQARLTRPACLTSRGFYICPMQGRLRIAGTVELGGLAAPPSQNRLDRLLEGARRVFPNLPAPSRSWMGFRPSIPDSLPVIGASRGGSDIIHAFGHGHLGLTLAPVTADIVTALVAGRPADRDISAVSPLRF
jgi:D-hydroxyproline dehydrogenase